MWERDHSRFNTGYIDNEVSTDCQVDGCMSLMSEVRPELKTQTPESLYSGLVSSETTQGEATQ